MAKLWMDVGPSFYAIHIIALIALGSSIGGALHIVYQQLSSSTSKGRRLLSTRLSFYISLSVLIFSVCHFIDHTLSLVYKSSINDQLCKALGFMVSSNAFTQCMFVWCMCINGYILIHNEKEIDAGPYDWKLIVFCVGGGNSLSFILLGLDTVGDQYAFCCFKQSTMERNIAALFAVSVPLSVVVTSEFFMMYRIHNKLKAIQEMISANKSEDASRRQVEERMAVIRKLLKFVLNVIVQWIPLTIFHMSWLIAGTELSTAFCDTFCIMGVSTFNFTGLVNVVLYNSVTQGNKSKSTNASTASYASVASKSTSSAGISASDNSKMEMA